MVALIDAEKLVPADHPIRDIKRLADRSLGRLSRSLEAMYSARGRRSVPPERLLKGMLLIALYSIRSEVQLCEQLRYNFMFRWFLDMDMVEEPFDHCAFSDNRERFLRHDIAAKFFDSVVREAAAAGLMSDEHFSVDGTLIEAWASTKSFKPKDDDDSGDGDSNGWSDFSGKKRSNETHASKTDPDAKLMRKGRGKEAKLSFHLHGLAENRNFLLTDMMLTEATGTCEREAALEMIDQSAPGATTLGGDAGYNTKSFVAACRSRGVTPHVSGKKKHSAIDGRTTRHAGYAVSQQLRKRAEQAFGWLKTIGGLRKTRYKGRERVELHSFIAGAAYNLVRMTKLMPSSA